MDCSKQNSDIYLTVQSLLDLQNDLITQGLSISASQDELIRKQVAERSLDTCNGILMHIIELMGHLKELT